MQAAEGSNASYTEDKLKTLIDAYRPDRPDRIAIIIKTINRKHLLFPTLKSIFRHADIPFRLYIGDDGAIDEEQRTIYERLRSAGHYVHIYDQPISFTAGLNHLAAATEDESYILRMDDDMRFCQRTRLSTLRRILEFVPAIGVISDAELQVERNDSKWGLSELRQNVGYLARQERTLLRLNIDPSSFCYTQLDGCRFAIIGHTFNFLLIRRTVIEKVPWNEELFVDGEHLEYFLRLAETGWLAAFTPDSVHEHYDDGIPPQTYTGRDRTPWLKAKKTVFSEQHGIDQVRKLALSQLLEDDWSRRTLRNLKRRFGAIRIYSRS
jgi:GT2 family glycosyltransferase